LLGDSGNGLGAPLEVSGAAGESLTRGLFLVLFDRLAACAFDLLADALAERLVAVRLDDEVVEQAIHEIQRPLGFVAVYVDDLGQFTLATLVARRQRVRAKVSCLAEVMEVVGDPGRVAALGEETVDLPVEPSLRLVAVLLEQVAE
jgi:hypothetical protein